MNPTNNNSSSSGRAITRDNNNNNNKKKMNTNKKPKDSTAKTLANILGSLCAAALCIWLTIVIIQYNPWNTHLNNISLQAFLLIADLTVASFINIFLSFHRDVYEYQPNLKSWQSSAASLELSFQPKLKPLTTLTIFIVIFDLLHVGFGTWSSYLYFNYYHSIINEYQFAIELYTILFLMAMGVFAIIFMLACCGTCCLFAINYADSDSEDEDYRYVSHSSSVAGGGGRGNSPERTYSIDGSPPILATDFKRYATTVASKSIKASTVSNSGKR
jgi:hypothetical protein